MFSSRLVTVVLTAAFSSPAPADVIRVDDDAPLGGDGLSWTTAYRYLQDALANVVAGTEIRVAQGTYKPDQDEAGNVIPGDREATFELSNGVTLLGGFAGLGTPDPDERNIKVYESILSGDLLGNDGPDFLNREENTHHVTTASGTDETAVLDGVVVIAGNAVGDPMQVGDLFPVLGGAGMLNLGGSPTVSNCTFTENAVLCTSDCENAHLRGAGIFVVGGSPRVTGCVVRSNVLRADPGMPSPHTGAGGGMAIEQSNASIMACVFEGNEMGASAAGGLWVLEGQSLVVECTFVDNMSRNGAGMTSLSNSTVVMNCVFDSNTAMTPRGWGGPISGGGALGDSETIFVNCVCSRNTAMEGYGGGLTGGTLVNCTIVHNQAEGNGGADSDVLTNCIVWGNIPNQLHTGSVASFSNVQGGWPGIGNIDADPMFVLPALSNCCSAHPGSGCGDCNSPHAGTGCSDSVCEALVCADDPYCCNVEWDEICAGDAEDLCDCGGGCDDPECEALVCAEDPNCCDVQWDTLCADEAASRCGKLCGPAAADLRLLPGSPCIDAGHNWAVAGLADIDLDGNPRFAADEKDFDPGCGLPVVVDMGAYEYQGDPFPVKLGDIDGNGVVNGIDFLLLLVAWGPCLEDCCLADFDLNGDVGATDFLTLLANWS